MATVSAPLGEFSLDRYTHLSDVQLQERMESIVRDFAERVPQPMPDFVHFGYNAIWVANLACRYFQVGLMAYKPQVIVYTSSEATAPHIDAIGVIVAIRCPGDPIFHEKFGQLVRPREVSRALCEQAAMVQDVWAWRVEQNPERFDRPTIRQTYLLSPQKG